ncbi:hypothetical protein BDQ17DRAFT_1347348 [Cyathus striatus]|nr:hypothetical protein BDQ17DRAFT_1347348 [Cyathus striatus]
MTPSSSPPPTTFPRASLLLLGANSISSLVPSTLISQVEALLSSHRVQEAAAQEEGLIEEEHDSLEYASLLLGFQCFTETRFEEAGKHFQAGNLDPRVLISYFPYIRGGMFDPGDDVELYAGVAERMPREASVDEIILNYSPHLAPSTKEARPTVELRRVLNENAERMLEEYLLSPKDIDAVVDTSLLKLYTSTSVATTERLTVLLTEQPKIILPEVEGLLKRHGKFALLCHLYRERGREEDVLRVLSGIVEGKYTDSSIPDAMSDILSILSTKRESLTKKGVSKTASSKDRQLLKKWGLWVVQRDVKQGLELLTPTRRKSRQKTREKEKGKERDGDEEVEILEDEDVALLREIENANPAAGRGSEVKELHNRFADVLLSDLLTSLKDESIGKLWRAKLSSYTSASNRSSTPFLSYIISTTPESEYKRTRLTTLLFLYSSGLYDIQRVRKRLVEAVSADGKSLEKVLSLEMAVIDGKLENHQAVLKTLIHVLKDAATAESYCSLGGEVISPKVATLLAEGAGFPGSFSSGSKPVLGMVSAGSKPADDDLRRNLLKILLEVYMNDPELSIERAGKLLDSQAVNLDVVDVISLVPATWPIRNMSSFLTRSFRRSLHSQHEGEMVKNISLGLNLEVREESWRCLREEGAVIAEEEEEEEETPEKGEYDEKAELVNNLGLHIAIAQSRETQTPGVVDVVTNGHMGQGVEVDEEGSEDGIR